MHQPRRYGTLIPHGEGGMATVYQGYDGDLGRHVALKFLHRDDPLWQQRLLREARLQARLHHPGICRVYDVGTAPDGRLYIAMEWIDGEELGAVAQHLPLSNRLDLVQQTATAVGAAHAAGLLHRDLKPSNILVRRPPADADKHPASDVAVVDFGLVWSMESQPLTQQGVLLGTPSYAAPELLRGTRTLWGPTLDVYGLGATLFHLIAGRPPFEGEELVHVMHAVLRDPAPDVREFAPQTPPALARVVARCLEKAPALRYPTMAVLAAELARVERVASTRPRGARAAAMRSGAVARRTARRLRRTPWLMAMMMAVIALTLVIAVQLRHEETRLTDARRYQALAGDWERALRAARLGQPGGLFTAKAEVRRRMAALEASADDARRGWAAAALGRGHLALGGDERAVAALARAWSDGVQTPQTALSYALALGRYHGDRLDAVDASGRSHRARITALLRWVEMRSADTSPIADRPVADYVPALLAYYDQRYDEAARRATRMAARHAWFYEAQMLVGQALLGRAGFEKDRDAIAAMHVTLRAAHVAYAEAAAIASGAPGPWVGQCAIAQRQLYAHAEWRADDSDVDAVALIDRYAEEARSACRTALLRDPEAIGAYANEAGAVWEWARAIYSVSDRDVRPALHAAIARLSAALRRHPQAARLYALRADLRWLIGRRALQFDGADPRAFYQHAARDYRRALRVQPDWALTYYFLSETYEAQLRYEAAYDLPIAPAWQLALRALAHAERIERRHPSPELRNGRIDLRRVVVHHQVAYARFRHGRDFGAHVERLFEATQRAVQAGGANTDQLRAMGDAYALRAFHRASNGHHAAAATAYRQMVAYRARVSQRGGGHPGDVHALLLGVIDVIRHDLLRGVDPIDGLRHADALLTQLEARSPQDQASARTRNAGLRIVLITQHLRRQYAGFDAGASVDGLRDRAAEAAALAWLARVDTPRAPHEDVVFYGLWRVWEAQMRGDATAALLAQAARAQQRMLANGGDPQQAALQDGILAVLRAQTADDPDARAAYLDEARAIWRRAFDENRWLQHRIPLWQRMAETLEAELFGPDSRPIG